MVALYIPLDTGNGSELVFGQKEIANLSFFPACLGWWVTG
jgi:hypothetical protein